MAQKQINEYLIFDDISRDLISLKLKNKNVTLGQAAAFCLDCLIAAQGKVVSQETLIEAGWRKHGFEVSSGNVRQVISQLRRAFSQLKESPDLLVTVHKLGYRLQVDLPIMTSIEEIQTVPTEVEQVELLEQFDPTLTDDHVITPVPVLLAQPKKFKAKYFIWAGILLLNAAIAISYFYTTRGSSLSHVQYQPYSAFPIKDKQLLVDKRILNNPELINHSLTMLISSTFWQKDNTHYRWVYLNAAANPEVHSFFLCDQPITEKHLQCVSRVFVGE
ncbi:winged helix-turn-helix domain-containing protein [Acinetobacter vivianii]|uniref:Winged helix-turn-helix domain-containing protein n=1 Tax=Acinetobacter vivianii TaxID=1776742 RepID=A0AAJ6P5U0_9GAMM|nr:winged helix-turn-helix domain-containing protein [Acinetobacter vivianii]WDZ51815.1 winged helix-turn-helix domain-containing protein [Acinetobacter vivianii]